MAISVAPFVGAWIETFCVPARYSAGTTSLPSWERGLKLRWGYTHDYVGDVAPFVGAWIETDPPCPCTFPDVVAPFVGAWIETLHCCFILSTAVSCRSLRGSVD